MAHHLLLGRLEESPPWKTVLLRLCKEAPPLALKSGPIFLIDGGVCKVHAVAAMVVTEGVNGFPEAVKGLEALNSRSTSLLTLCWFKRANIAHNP